ncbi:MAG: acetyltransferase [Hyphomicrobiaceae bacterium]|nr:MAG: acetyltransferase [Hyphomicrobiaceae bacterium]
MVERLFIIGAGRHAAVVLDAVRAQGAYEMAGFIDDKLAAGTLVEGEAVLGPLADLGRLAQERGCCTAVVAIGANHMRRRVAETAASLVADLRWATVIHPSAVIARGVVIGAGSMIIASATLNIGTRIGRHCIVNTGSVLDHDTLFGDFASTGPGVTLGGNVSLGCGGYIGIGASVKHRVSIGEETVIGAHSLVLADCAPRSVYYGVPARRIRGRTPEDEYL